MSQGCSEPDGADRASHPSRLDSSPPLHLKSFKLRFASQRELGRSDVSAVKPLRLPAVVRAKFYRREPEGEVDERAAERALDRVRDTFRRGPREKYDEPQTTSNEYGWWGPVGGGEGVAARGRRESAWLKERLRVLAADAGLRRR